MTNRPDLWGHYGIAREIAALYKLPMKKIEPVKVDAKSGSVIITFDAATLNALGVGDHVIKVIFDDWVDELKLVIKAPVAPIADATPTTGDSSLPVLWVTLLLLSMAGASAVVMRRRNNRREILCEIGETD